jgi:hypothetical protein
MWTPTGEHRPSFEIEPLIVETIKFHDYPDVSVDEEGLAKEKREKMTIAGLLLVQRVEEKRFRITSRVRVIGIPSGKNCHNSFIFMKDCLKSGRNPNC